MKTTETKVKRIEDDDGNLVRMTYYLNDRIHRDGNNPALLEYNGNVFKEFYYSHGELHREDGAAIRVWEGSSLIREEYYINGFLHNEYGPAVWVDGTVKYSAYWLNGKELNKQKWLRKIFSAAGKDGLDDKLLRLEACGCYPIISYRGGNTWRAHINGAGNFWGEGRSPLEALDEAIIAWRDADFPMDGYGEYGQRSALI